MLTDPIRTPEGSLNDYPLHTLWSKAVGTEGYDKDQWMRLEAKLHNAMAEVERLREENDALKHGLANWTTAKVPDGVTVIAK